MDSGPVEVEVVSKPQWAAVELNVQIDGGTVASGRAAVLMARLAGTTPIINARIEVQIFNADSDSDQPVKTVVLTNANDNGQGVDGKANDGLYSASVSDLPAGSYFALAVAKTDPTSQFNPNGVINAAGVSAGAAPVGLIQR